MKEADFWKILEESSTGYGTESCVNEHHDGAMLGEIIDLGKPAPLKGKPWSEGDKAFFLKNYPRCCDKWGVP